jgi:hypothetical protein
MCPDFSLVWALSFPVFSMLLLPASPLHAAKALQWSAHDPCAPSTTRERVE